MRTGRKHTRWRAESLEQHLPQSRANARQAGESDMVTEATGDRSLQSSCQDGFDWHGQIPRNSEHLSSCSSLCGVRQTGAHRRD